jgi:uroporphyrinogen-III decarboxylase
MTSRERLLTALRGGVPDRVPMPLRMWKFLRKYYPDTNDPLEKALRAHDEFGIDLWHYALSPILPCFSPTSEPWREDITVEVNHEVRNNRNIWDRTIYTPEGELHDVKQALIVHEGSGSGPEIVEPLVKDFNRDLPLMRYMQAEPERLDLEKAKEVDRSIGDRGLMITSLYSPIDCRDMLKPADFLMLYYDDREAFREIVDIGAEAMMEETRCVLEAGFEVLQTWWFYASPSYGWSPRIYEEMFLPHLIKHVELVHEYGALYVYYDDGKMSRFIDMYVNAGIDCLMTLTPPPMGDVVPAEVKQRYGADVVLMGGVDAVNEIYLSEPSAIRTMVEERLEILKPGGAYILDGSNSLVYETPPENVRAFAQAGLEFGAY